MEIKVFRRRHDHDAAALLESITKSTTLVRVDQADYTDAYDYSLPFEDRLLGNVEDMLAHADKLLGIVDMELFMLKPMTVHELHKGDIIELPTFGTFIKAGHGYTPAEIKNKKF